MMITIKIQTKYLHLFFGQSSGDWIFVPWHIYDTVVLLKPNSTMNQTEQDKNFQIF
jgi:TRAP-type mannitol/chloroaromatic compound transport system permease small subunit